MPELAISREKVSFLIERAHEFDVKDLPTDEESGSNPADDAEVDILQDDGSDSVAAELASFIRALNEDEQIDLIRADLARTGRRHDRRVGGSA